jgi:hypothetical protein
MIYLLFAEIDECSSNPCQHEGTCTDYVNAFQCSCKAGYKGNVCQTSKSIFLTHIIQYLNVMLTFGYCTKTHHKM